MIARHASLHGEQDSMSCRNAQVQRRLTVLPATLRSIVDKGMLLSRDQPHRFGSQCINRRKRGHPAIAASPLCDEHDYALWLKFSYIRRNVDAFTRNRAANEQNCQRNAIAGIPVLLFISLRLRKNREPTRGNGELPVRKPPRPRSVAS